MPGAGLPPSSLAGAGFRPAPSAGAASSGGDRRRRLSPLPACGRAARSGLALGAEVDLGDRATAASSGPSARRRQRS
uniref:Uncharacterized protein n=1 Tax=Oryza nivara TaxID=4536 RepID=A0A0E0IR60_ORYNI